MLLPLLLNHTQAHSPSFLTSFLFLLSFQCLSVHVG